MITWTGHCEKWNKLSSCLLRISDSSTGCLLCMYSKGQRELCPPAYTGAAVLALCVFVDCMRFGLWICISGLSHMRPTIHQCNWTRPQLIHLCFCLSSWHCLWNSQSWSPRLLARQIWGDHPSRRPALHCQACQACSSQFKHRWRRCKRDSTLAIMSINADCLHVCLRLSAWITLFPSYHDC